VRDLRVDAPGARVERGEALFSVYSPELVSAQAEYLSARASHSAELESAARARLRRWGVEAVDIAALERHGSPLEAVPVRAPASGFVVEKNAVEGAAFEAGTRLFRIGPLDTVWIEAEVYGSDLPALSPGQAARVSSPTLPGREAEARVAAILPALANESRTARVRLVLGNGDLALRPEMWVDVDVHVDLGERVLVTSSAVIVSGDRRMVFVDRGGGVLEPRLIRTGISNGPQVEVLEGLEPGERVVASGNFLIAAESRIQSALEP
jgi:membrane fusion protein, copper/silver efflux system